jgi:DNA replication protein DnaC
MDIQELTLFYSERFNHYGYMRKDESFDKLAAYNAYYYQNLARKGIFLTGITGTGKSMFLGVLNSIYKIPIYIAEDLVNMWKSDERACIDVLNQTQTSWEDGKEYDMCIDDMGTEVKASIYGEKKEILEHIIYRRYELFKSNGAKTFISCNLTEQALMDRYGDRIYSRLNEMCNFIEIKGVDNRIKNKGGA